MKLRKGLGKLWLLGISLLTVTAVSISSDCYGWIVTANFSQGEVGKPAQGPSGFDEAGQRTVFSNDDVAPYRRPLKISWEAGSSGGSELGFARLPSKLSEGGELWYKASLYFKSPWRWDCDPVVKLMRSHVANAAGDHIGYTSIFWSAGGNLTLSNEVADYEPTLGVFLDIDKWQDIEMYVKYSVNSPIFRIWKNGQLVTEDKTHRTLNATTDQADFIYLMSYWNGKAPQNQIEYVANVVLTNESPPNLDSNGNPMISFPPNSAEHTPPASVQGLATKP